MSRLNEKRRNFRRAFTASLLLALALAVPAHAADAPYVPADEGARPRSGSTSVLPETFLRGFDPITVYFKSDVGAAHGPADDGAKHLRIAPAWPGAYVWVDSRTLQFRPAEPWPALARFAIDAHGTRRILSTLMSAPQAMSPAAGSDELRPFRTLTLTFPQALPLETLRKMITLEVRALPGLASAKRRLLEKWTLAPLPRANQRDPAVYAITLDADVPEGQLLQVSVSLALGDEGTALWTGRASTRLPFHLESVVCGSATFPVQAGASAPRDLALSCGSAGESPQLVFSAPVKDLTLTELSKLVRLEPSVPDLHFETYGSRVTLRGAFVPDTLYRMRLAAAEVRDDAGRALASPGEVELFFYLGWRTAFLRWSQSTALLEARGPRMVPLVGYGDARADVRVYKIDPLFNGLWPFPASPLTVDEQRAPPFPGEEPAETSLYAREGGTLTPEALTQHLRLLGSPLVSRIVDLPLTRKSKTTRFGLDLGALLDGVVGKNQPGTYLVGVRRLSGPPQRSYLRVQVSNLSVTTVEDHDRAVFFVRTLDTAEPVRGATVTLEGLRRSWKPDHSTWTGVPDQVTATTDAQGRAELLPVHDWDKLGRLSVKSGDDVLVLDPSEPPPRFANNHWSLSEGWLSWLLEKVPPPPNDKLLGFVFTERPIYRPGEKVFIKGYLRNKVGGKLTAPGDASLYGLKVDGLNNQSWTLPLDFTPLAGFSATFDQKDLATGPYTATLFLKESHGVIASRDFQIEAYRIPTFEVRFAGATTVRLDQPFSTKALARYYAGGSVAGQPISWSVTQRPYRYVPKGREGFLFASSTQFARPGAAKPREPITRAANLDAAGADVLSVNPALDIDGSARVYHFEATVTGPDNQPVSAVQDVLALPPFVLGMKLQRYAPSALNLEPQIISVGVDDALLAGQAVRVRLYKRVWHSHLRETNFASGEAKYVTEQEDVLVTEKKITTAAKAVIPSFPIRDAGVYVVELMSRDRLGRVQTLSADLYVGGPKPLAWQKSREGVFSVTTDQKRYAPGETAKLIIESPFQSGRALVIAEEPGGNRYSWVKVNGGKAIFEQKIDPRFVPNLPVHVVLMRGRIADALPSSHDDARYRPETVAASLDLEIKPVKNEVLVAVSHPESARPGTTVDFKISLTDDAKRPVAGEVTLWLVDEAVLSLAKEDPLDPLGSLIDRNARVSSIRDTRNTVVGRLLEQEENPGGDGEGGVGSGEGSGAFGTARVIRKNFRTVPYYAATLQIPASGTLTVPIKLSDDLTNFKVRAVAASGLERFGYQQSVLHVRLPVLVQPQLPRFVRQGDRFFAGGIARLTEGKDGPGLVDVKVTGPAKSQGGKEAVQLAQSKPASVRVPVEVTSAAAGTPGQLAISVGVTRKSDGASDAFEVKLPVLPDRTVEHVAFFDTVKDGKLVAHPLPEAAREGTVTQALTLTNVPGVLALAAGLDYLGRYPHGCLEQQLSQLYPQVAQGVLLGQLGLAGGARAENTAHVKKLLSELPTFQDEQGLVSYWPGGKGDVALTAQLVDFLQDVKRAGIAVDAKVEGRATAALQRALRSDYPGLLADFRYDQQTEAIRALAHAGQLDEHYLIELFNRRGEMDPWSLAALADAMDAKPGLFKAQLAALEGDLWNTVKLELSRGRPVFAGMSTRRAGWGDYLGSPASSAASVLQSLVTLDPANAKLSLLRDGVLTFADPVRGWGSTYGNRRAISALGAYLSSAKEKLPPATIALTGGATVKLDGTHRVFQERRASAAPVVGTVQGGPVGERLAMSYLPAAPGDHAAALHQGFVVSRSATVLHADGSPQTRFDDAVGATRTLQVGDVLELHTRVVTDEDRSQVAIVVPFAAGLEPLNPALANAGSDARPSEADSLEASYVERLDSEVRYYFLSLPKGSHSFHFRVRAASEGSFVQPAPYAELMYREEVRGRGEGMRIVVSGGHAK